MRGSPDQRMTGTVTGIVRRAYDLALQDAIEDMSLPEGKLFHLVTLRMANALCEGADSVDREDFTRNTRDMLALIWDKSVEARNY